MRDIDETSLSNWLEIDQDDFGYIPGGACTPQDLIMRPISSPGSATEYKSSKRKAIQDPGHKIIVNVGDQLT